MPFDHCLFMQYNAGKYRFFVSGIFLLLFFVGFGQHSPIFPQPQQFQSTGEDYTHQQRLTLTRDAQTEALVKVFTPLFSEQCGIQLQLVENEEPTLRTAVAKTNKAGYYHLLVNKSGVSIESNDQQGLFYAMQSLLQLSGTTAISGADVHDAPNFRYRGVHLDCARHFFTLTELKGFIDEIARLKFNTFHWHLTDDQGWRIEIKKYPKLTEIGGWRDSTLIGHFSNTPITYDHVRYGGYYTQDEARELVAYAQERGITIIPEIEMPGHARAALAAYPELGCTGIQQGVSGTWGVFDDVFCTKPQTIAFLKDVLAEIITVFPSETIHIGGDETPKVRWKVCPACQQQIKDHHLHDEHELQSYVVSEMANFLSERGRKLMGWDEILEGGLAENAQVMSWRGTEGGIAAAKAKHHVVMTPTSYCYLDYYQSGSPGEPLAIGGYLPLEKVYSFNPIPKELNEEEKQYILGGQANLWTEYLQTMSAVQYQAFPRLVAIAEVLWTQPENRGDYNAFASALSTYAFPYYQKQHINYSSAAFEPTLTFVPETYGITLQPGCPVAGTTTTIEIGTQRHYNIQESKTVEVAEGCSQSTLARYLDYFPPRVTVIPTKQEHQLDIDVSTLQNGTVLRTNTYTITSHLALGRPAVFETPPSEKYNVHGTIGLTDGICGKTPWKGNQWLGFETDSIRFEIDMGRKLEIGNIQLGTLHDPGSWIYGPKEVVISCSKNGRSWKTYEVTVKEANRFVLAKQQKTRYIRVLVVNDAVIPDGMPGAGFTPWTFLDELIITK